jgi:recombination protein RecA
VAFIDAEHALDPTYARALGVDVDNMLISQRKRFLDFY